MDLLHALVIGAYGSYAALAGVYVALRDKLDELRTNHLRHLEDRVKALEDKAE